MMKGSVKVDLTPLNNLAKRSTISKILRKSIKKASKVVQTAVKNNSQKVRRFGYLAKSIGVKVRIYNGVAVAMVGPRSKWVRVDGVYTKGKHKGEPKRFRPSFYEHFLEGGGKRFPARPVERPAMESTNEEFLKQFSDLIREGVAAELKRM